jgi:hypothetical protein
LLPKARLHISLGLIVLGFVFAYLRVYEFAGVLIFFGILAAALSIFIAKDLEGKYKPLLHKGKSTTADHVAAVLKKKDVETVIFELHSLFDRGYLPGFTLNYETHAITPVAVRGAIEGLVKTVNSTVSTIKGGQDSVLTCQKCGATIQNTDSANCEFCGAPLGN